MFLVCLRSLSPAYSNLQFVLFAFMILLTACEEKTLSVPSPAEPVQDVSVVELQPQRLVISTELSGRVSAFEVAEVRPQVGGIIQKRIFEEGADVQRGDVLYQIDPAIYQADMDSAKANFDRAEANVVPALLKMNRFTELVRINAVSRQEYEDAQAAYKQAVAAVNVSKAAVENARIRLDYTQVISPISGRISRSEVTPGALVTENQNTPLTTVQQLDHVYVDVTQSSTEVLRLKRALDNGKLQRADAQHAVMRLLLEDGSEYAHTGTLQFTDISVDESTGVVTLRAIFPNPQSDLMPGMYVRGVLAEGVDEQALLLPQPALLRDARGNASVYVVENGKVATRSVHLGRTHGPNWIVLDGLAPGDRVVVGGTQKIRAGTAVAIVANEKAMQLAASTNN